MEIGNSSGSGILLPDRMDRCAHSAPAAKLEISFGTVWRCCRIPALADSHRDRMSKPTPARYRTTNWSSYTAALQGRRQWRKVHLAMDTATSDIRAVEFTPASDGDSPVLPELLGQIPEDKEIGTVTADGAYDTRRCHSAIIDRQAIAIIPIRKNGRPWKEDCGSDCQKRHPPRHTALRPGVLEALAFWKRWKDTTSEAGSRRRCPRRFARTCGAQPARPQRLWRTHFRKRPGPPKRRNPDPHRTHEPLLGPRNGRDRPRGLMTAGKGAIMPQA